MPDTNSLRRLGGGRWETRDGRFAIEPQSGTWVIVDNEQTDELGLPLVRGPFGSLTAAKEAIDVARSGGPTASPLAERIEKARVAGKARPEAGRSGTREASSHGSKARLRSAAPAESEPPPEPKWLRDLEPGARRRARDLIVRLGKMGVADPERVVRVEIAAGEPALARLAIERAVGKAMASSESNPNTIRAVISAILRGGDVELGVSWKLVDDQGRPIDKVDIPE